MIRLTFIAQNRDIISLEIEGKIVKYYDKLWRTGVQFLPKDPQFILKLIKARNTIPFSQHIISWINESNSGENLKQYLACNTEEDIAEVIRRDCALKGLIEVKK